MNHKIIGTITVVILGFTNLTAQKVISGGGQEEKKYEIAVYYFPNYHPDSINEKWHGKGWTEWEVVKAAKPRFPGHDQPKVPSWGYFNEADPIWAAKEIDLAADNGIDCFIYDWYWYSNTGQYLQEGLEKGFLKAPNRNRLKFAIMWANHDWLNIQPATFDNSRIKLTDGRVSWQLWDTISTYIVEKYFKQPNYWKIDGEPYFSIYDIINFVNGLGGIANAKKAISLLDKKAKNAGFPGVHFNIMSWMINDQSARKIEGSGRSLSAKGMIKGLGCQSVSTYAFIHHFDFGNAGFPTVPYDSALEANKKYWNSFIKNYPGLLYTPNVSMGWDASPRCMQSDKFEQRDYPWTPVLTGNTPEAFERALLDAKHFLDKYNPRHKILVLNSWNEWTEGSYLLPEKKYGDAYLKAVRKVFGDSPTVHPAQKQPSDEYFCVKSREASLIPIRPGIPGKRPFWNEKARLFKHVPSFNNNPNAEITPVQYRYSAFSFTNKEDFSFTAATGTEPLSPIWDKLPVGNIYLKIEGIDSIGNVCLAKERMFYKAGTFYPPYTRARYSYREALLKGLLFLYNQKYIKEWYFTGKPDHKEMPLYSYSSKVAGSVIDGMLLYNKYFPGNDTSLAIARKAADYMILKAESAQSPLAYFPQTYEGGHLAAGIYGNEILMSEPAWTGITFLDLYDRTKDIKYFNAAVNIANTYLKNQLPSGTWYIRINKATGKPASEVLCIPTNIIDLLSILMNKYRQGQFKESIRSAFKWIMDNPMKTFDWTGQFEDVGAAKQYRNLTHFGPSWLAMHLLDNMAKDTSYVRLAKELMDFCEDQFVIWEKPDIYDDRNDLANGWQVPAALEQYNCYLPIDGSTDQMIFTFCKAYAITGDPIYRAKAIALAGSIVNCQREDGMIPTFLTRIQKNHFWPNCMVYSLRMLEKMSTLDYGTESDK